MFHEVPSPKSVFYPKWLYIKTYRLLKLYLQEFVVLMISIWYNLIRHVLLSKKKLISLEILLAVKFVSNFTSSVFLFFLMRKHDLAIPAAKTAELKFHGVIFSIPKCSTVVFFPLFLILAINLNTSFVLSQRESWRKKNISPLEKL